MKWEYALILGLTVLFPLVFSTDRNLPLRRNAAALSKTIVLVSIPYWLWDIAVTGRGHWSFNPAHVLGPALLGLPVEEWFFFPVIVFVSVFTWESTLYFLRRRK